MVPSAVPSGRITASNTKGGSQMKYLKIALNIAEIILSIATIVLVVKDWNTTPECDVE